MSTATNKSPRLKLYGRIHSLLAEAGIDDAGYRDILYLNFNGAESKSKLTERQLLHLVQHLESLVPGKQRQAYPGRPRNMNKPGDSRTEQLKKIEALLTIGKLPWSYADAIAKQMRLADTISWVKTGDLYRVITALRKKAQKEGWDLSGESDK